MKRKSFRFLALILAFTFLLAPLASLKVYADNTPVVDDTTVGMVIVSFSEEGQVNYLPTGEYKIKEDNKVTLKVKEDSEYVFKENLGKSLDLTIKKYTDETNKGDWLLKDDKWVASKTVELVKKAEDTFKGELTISVKSKDKSLTKEEVNSILSIKLDGVDLNELSKMI